MRCISVDDDPQWLARTEAFLRVKSVPTGELWTEPELEGVDLGSGVDLIVYDFSGFERRRAYLRTLSRFAHGDTLFLFDDCQPRSDTVYRQALQEWCWADDIALVSLEHLTRDGFGRWGALGHYRASDFYADLVGQRGVAARRGHRHAASSSGADAGGFE